MPRRRYGHKGGWDAPMHVQRYVLRWWAKAYDAGRFTDYKGGDEIWPSLRQRMMHTGPKRVVAACRNANWPSSRAQRPWVSSIGKGALIAVLWARGAGLAGAKVSFSSQSLLEILGDMEKKDYKPLPLKPQGAKARKDKDRAGEARVRELLATPAQDPLPDLFAAAATRARAEENGVRADLVAALTRAHKAGYTVTYRDGVLDMMQRTRVVEETKGN